MLARLGRAVALLFTLWLLGLLLAGLGILPAGLIPLGHSVGAQSPPALPSFPVPRLPSKSDLAAAKPLSSSAAGTTAVHGSPAAAAAKLTASTLGAVPGQRGAAGHGPGSTSRPVKVAGGTGASSGPGGGAGVGASQGATPPGQAVSQSSPGHTNTSPGNSGSAPGQIKQTSTTSTTSTSTSPGQSGSAPGQTRTHGTGGGNGY